LFVHVTARLRSTKIHFTFALCQSERLSGWLQQKGIKGIEDKKTCRPHQNFISSLRDQSMSNGRQRNTRKLTVYIFEMHAMIGLAPVRFPALFHLHLPDKWNPKPNGTFPQYKSQAIYYLFKASSWHNVKNLPKGNGEGISCSKFHFYHRQISAKIQQRKQIDE
jgi:hypothetical protein